MVEYTRPATWADVLTLAQHLSEAGVEYALVGGYAIAAHGFNRFSEDVDILVNPSREGHYAIRVNDEFTIDVMPAACGHTWEELRSFIEDLEIEGRHLKVLSLEGFDRCSPLGIGRAPNWRPDGFR